LKPHVTEVLVCDSRKNALLRVGNKNDREDARKLSELLFLNKLHPVYHVETGIRTLKELARSYLTITRDLTRVMNRLKANGMKPPMARLTLARKIAAITLLVWKKVVRFDAEQLKQQAA
jgi:hypothetical protein